MAANTGFGRAIRDFLELFADYKASKTSNRQLMRDLIESMEMRYRMTMPRLALARMYGSVTAPTLLRTFCFGDSVAEFKPKHLLPVLERSMVGNAANQVPNTAGTTRPPYQGGDCGAGASVGLTTLLNQWAYFPDGQLYQIGLGGSVTWVYGGVNPTFTKLKIYYIKEAGGGTFTVTVNGVLQATINTDNGGGIALGVYTFNQARGQAPVITASTIGIVKLVEVHKIDEGFSGIDNYPVAVGGISLNDAMSTATGRANLQAYLADAAPDLAFFEMKEASLYGDGTTYETRLGQLADIMDAAIPNADKVMIGSTPIAVNDADQVAQNSTLAALCAARGYIYWDGYSPVKDYATLVALGWQGDGTHVDNKANAYLASRMYHELGFDNVIMAMAPRAVVDRQTPSALGRGTTIGKGSGGQIQFNTDASFGFDWDILYPRLLALKKDDGTLVAQFSANTGVFPNVLPMTAKFDTANPAAAPSGTQGMKKSTATGVTELQLEDLAKAAPSLLHLHTGCFMPGPYTKAQLPLPGNHNGYIAWCTDAIGGATHVYASGAAWLRLRDNAAI